MKCNIKTMNAVRELMVADFEEQVLGQEDVWIDELEQGLREDLVALGNAIMGEVLSSYDEQVNGAAEKCACGGGAKRQLRRSASLLSVFGWLTYTRGYYHCIHCGKREYRLDADQGIQAGQASRGMARLMSMAGVTTSFAEAPEQLEAYLLVSVSPNTIRKETYAAGQRQAVREAQEQAESQLEERLQQRERRLAGEERLARVYGSVDGAQAPTTTGWREVKSLAWYQSRPRYGHRDQFQAAEIEYRSEISPAETFGQLLWASALRYQVDRAQEVVFVCDGAPWIWKLVEQYFPGAVQIVDWYHACGYLSQIAQAVFADQGAADRWTEQIKALLWQGDIQAVLAACQAYVNHPQASQAAAKAITYYSNNPLRMNYPAYRKMGISVGVAQWKVLANKSSLPG